MEWADTGYIRKSDARDKSMIWPEQLEGWNCQELKLGSLQ